MQNILLNFVYGFIAISLIACGLYGLFIIKILMPIVLVLLVLASIYLVGDMIRYYINFKKNKL